MRLFSLLNGSENESSQVPTDLHNPFMSDKVERIMIGIYNSDGFWRKEVEVICVIYFKNEDTKAEQRFSGKDLNEVIAKADAFLKQI